MKNTGIVYISDEKTPVVLPEFANLLPPLSAEQLERLEADIMENGCYSPVIATERRCVRSMAYLITWWYFALTAGWTPWSGQ